MNGSNPPCCKVNFLAHKSSEKSFLLQRELFGTPRSLFQLEQMLTTAIQMTKMLVLYMHFPSSTQLQSLQAWQSHKSIEITVIIQCKSMWAATTMNYRWLTYKPTNSACVPYITIPSVLRDSCNTVSKLHPSAQVYGYVHVPYDLHLTSSLATSPWSSRHILSINTSGEKQRCM